MSPLGSRDREARLSVAGVAMGVPPVRHSMPENSTDVRSGCLDAYRPPKPASPRTGASTGEPQARVLDHAAPRPAFDQVHGQQARAVA